MIEKMVNKARNGDREHLRAPADGDGVGLRFYTGRPEKASLRRPPGKLSVQVWGMPV